MVRLSDISPKWLGLKPPKWDVASHFRQLAETLPWYVHTGSPNRLQTVGGLAEKLIFCLELVGISFKEQMKFFIFFISFSSNRLRFAVTLHMETWLDDL